jgi:hypothetical protein
MGPRIGIKFFVLAFALACISLGCSGSGEGEPSGGENVFKDTEGSTGRASAEAEPEAGKAGRAR